MPDYQQPPAEIVAILDAPRPPVVARSPDGAWMALLERPALPPIAEVAAPIVRVAGVRIDPRTHGPARENPYSAVSLRRVERRSASIPVPVPGRIRSASFDADVSHLALTVMEDAGIALWVADVGEAPNPRRLLGPVLQAGVGAPCDWLPGGEGLVCRVVPGNLGAAPVADTVPKGPRVAENRGRAAPARTYADLLQSAQDEANLDHYLTSEVVVVGLDGTVRPLLPAGVWTSVQPSPDGAWVLASRVVRPYSYSVPLHAFARHTEVVERATGRVVTIADLPVADAVPITYDSVRTGRRAVGWRADQAATLWMIEALDGGDAGRTAAVRDALDVLDAPFTEEAERLWSAPLRITELQWGDAHLALVSEDWYATRKTRTVRIDPSDPTKAPVVVWDRSSQDRYGDPGTPLTAPGAYGAEVLRQTPTGGLLLAGAGISPTGVHPFLDRFEWTETTRLWQSEDPWQESVLDVLDDEGRSFLTMRQSQTEVPNVVRRSGKKVESITNFQDWAPTFSEVRKEVVSYSRADGLPLSATVYFPPGHEPKRDGPLPAVFWVYPSEFKRRSDAGQTTAPGNTFTRPGGASALFFLLHGYIVVDDPQLPIVAEGDEQPNDTYIAQLVSGAEAAVTSLSERGWIDPTRLVVGGHSYGAFTTANLLAHTDLFRAGIARSGAYNRTLTPFGFQGEERNFWQAQATYVAMSPFTVADRVDEPLLMIHGADDANPGTWPLQTARMYEALKGNGATVRWVELPFEDHGYRARESNGHVLWEMFGWADENTSVLPAAPSPER